MAREKETLPGITESRRGLNFEALFRQVGLVVLLAIIISALSGLFSNGYFSSAQKENNAHTLAIHYERFGRLQTEFELRFFTRSLPAESYIFSINGELNTMFEPGAISPQPDSMFSEGKTLYLIYRNVKTQGDFSVRMFVTPTGMGKSVNSIKVNSEPEIRFWQFIYP